MRLGRYDVIRDLKQGGMARTMLARSSTGRVVVLKTPLGDDPSLAARLRDEARVGERLQHPGVVETLDLFEHEGRTVLVVGYIDGCSVEQLRKRAALPAPAVAALGAQIGAALHALHNATDETLRPLGIVHRDVTSANVLVDRRGRARLIDLGIARMGIDGDVHAVRSAVTEPGAVIGTVRYLAPEIADGAPQSPATDAWALGCVLFEAATGLPCYPGRASEAVLAILSGSPLDVAGAESVEDERLRAALAAIFARAASMRPSCDDIARSMRALLADYDAASTTSGVEHLARAVDAAAGPPELASPASTDPPLSGLSGAFAAAPAAPNGPDLPAVAAAPPAVTTTTPAPSGSDGAGELATAPPRVAPRSALPAVVTIGAIAALAAGIGVGAASLLRSDEDDADDHAARTVHVDAGAAPVIATPVVRAAELPHDAGVVVEPPRAAVPDNKRDDDWRPECWTGVGALIYLDEAGTPSIVDDPIKVPRRFRKSARCAS